MGNNDNLPNGWNNFWIKAGITGFGAYKLYDAYNSYMTDMKSDKTKVNIVHTNPTFSPKK